MKAQKVLLGFNKNEQHITDTPKKFIQTYLDLIVKEDPILQIDQNLILNTKKKFNINEKELNILLGIGGSGPTKRIPAETFLKLIDKISRIKKCKFFLVTGKNDDEQIILNQILHSKFHDLCVPLDNMSIKETLPLIKNCNISICNDTGFGHLSAALGVKTITLMADAPLIYGNYNSKMFPIIPDGETTVRHRTNGKDRINSDKIFAMLLQLGTPMNIASFPLLEAKKIANVSPLTAARQMIEPPSAYKYAGTSSYYDQMRTSVPYLSETTGVKNICSMYIPSDFGLEIAEGTKDAVAEAGSGLTFGGETKHKPDELDFVGSLSKLKASGCELVTVALGVKQTLTVLGTAKKMGLTDLKFLGGSASFHTLIAKVPGGPGDGFYAASGWADIVARMGDPVVGGWVAKYTEESGGFPGTGALLGRSAAEVFVRALEAAGHDLTSASFQAGMESLNFEDKISGVMVTITADNHQGANDVIISQVQGDNWVELARR